MPPVGFELIISASELSQTHALDRAATSKVKGKIYPLQARYGPEGG